MYPIRLQVAWNSPRSRRAPLSCWEPGGAQAMTTFRWQELQDAIVVRIS